MSNSDGFERKKNRKIFKKRTHTHTHTLPSSLPRISTCVSCPWSFALPALRSQRRSASPQTLQRPLKCARCPALGTRSPRCTRPSGRAGRCPERERERERERDRIEEDQSINRLIESLACSFSPTYTWSSPRLFFFLLLLLSPWYIPSFLGPCCPRPASSRAPSRTPLESS